MIYKNDSNLALMAMERSRTGNYGDYIEEKPIIEKCPVCGSDVEVVYGLGQEIKEFYRVDDDIIGCNLYVEKINEYGLKTA